MAKLPSPALATPTHVTTCTLNASVLARWLSLLLPGTTCMRGTLTASRSSSCFSSRKELHWAKGGAFARKGQRKSESMAQADNGRRCRRLWGVRHEDTRYMTQQVQCMYV